MRRSEGIDTRCRRESDKLETKASEYNAMVSIVQVREGLSVVDGGVVRASEEPNSGFEPKR